MGSLDGQRMQALPCREDEVLSDHEHELGGGRGGFRCVAAGSATIASTIDATPSALMNQMMTLLPLHPRDRPVGRNPEGRGAERATIAAPMRRQTCIEGVCRGACEKEAAADGEGV